MPPDPRHRARELLERSWLLETLAASARDRLLARLPQRGYADGQLIFGQGDRGGSLLLVVRGRVKIGATSREGRELILGIVEAGELFGEIALLDGKARSADAVAFGDCVVASLERRDLLDVLRQSPEAAIRLLEFVCGRVRAANARLEDIVFQPVEARLARLLLARVDGSPGPGPSAGLSQSDLASLIGASRQTVNQVLGCWDALGIVSRAGRRLAISDRERLAAIASASGAAN
jgi:CRP-like cAMP-binding protein